MFKDFVFHFRLKICMRTKQLCITELAAIHRWKEFPDLEFPEPLISKAI